MAALSREEIRTALNWNPPLVDGYVDVEAQLQPNGFDLSLQQVAQFTSSAQISGETSQRVISHNENLSFGNDGFLELATGPYLITFNEVVNLPPHLMALGKPRSSLLRSGVAVHGAVWDAGYRGRSQALLTVHNPHGFRVARNARLLQLIFFTLETPTQQGYTGFFQGENL